MDAAVNADTKQGLIETAILNLQESIEKLHLLENRIKGDGNALQPSQQEKPLPAVPLANFLVSLPNQLDELNKRIQLNIESIRDLLF